MAIRQDYWQEAASQLGVPPLLTPRESVVLELVAQGLSTRQAAATLYVSEQAITYHIGNLLSKFACENRAGLVARAFIFGYLDPLSWPPRHDSEASRLRARVIRPDDRVPPKDP